MVKYYKKCKEKKIIREIILKNKNDIYIFQIKVLSKAMLSFLTSYTFIYMIKIFKRLIIIIFKIKLCKKIT